MSPNFECFPRSCAKRVYSTHGNNKLQIEDKKLSHFKSKSCYADNSQVAGNELYFSWICFIILEPAREIGSFNS